MVWCVRTWNVPLPHRPDPRRSPSTSQRPRCRVPSSPSWIPVYRGVSFPTRYGTNSNPACARTPQPQPQPQPLTNRRSSSWKIHHHRLVVRSGFRRSHLRHRPPPPPLPNRNKIVLNSRVMRSIGDFNPFVYPGGTRIRLRLLLRRRLLSDPRRTLRVPRRYSA